MSKLQVICFYWEGDRWKSSFDGDMPVDGMYRAALQKTGEVSLDLASKYINNLYRGVKKHAVVDFDFICFTNEPLRVLHGVELRSFPMHTTKGVLPRLHMFSEEAGLFGHQVLCIDIDVIVTGSLEKIMAYDGLFCARSKFRPQDHWKLDGDVMSFQAGPETEELFWKPFIADVDAAVKLVNGRERYWMRHVAKDWADRWEDVAPGTVVSYKWHVMKNKMPAQAAIVSCHGIPRPHQVVIPKYKEHWNGR